MRTYRLPEEFGNFRNLVYFLLSCAIVKMFGLAIYAYWVVVQNRKRKQLARELGISEEDSNAFNIIAENKDMTDVENIHFMYGY